MGIAVYLLAFLSFSCKAYTKSDIKNCDVHDYGAVGDGKAYDTLAIQKAIDDCATGQGAVTFKTGGIFLSGTLLLHDGVHLSLQAGTELRASTRRQDYGTKQEEWYLVKVENCDGCIIEGSGVINGQSEKWVADRWPDRKVMHNWEDPSCRTPSECRPRLVGIVNSTKVQVTGVELRNSVYWCLHIWHSSKVVVQGVKINGDFDVPNNDGIDIDGSSQVAIKGCNITAGDDAICAKTTVPGTETTDLFVSTCTLKSKSSAIKIGSESHGNFRNLVFEDIVIRESHRGLGIQIRDEGNLTDVRFSRIKVQTQLYNQSWWGAGEPIYVTRMFRRPDQAEVGRVDGVVLEDIQADSENGVVISGMQSSMLGNISIRRLALRMVKVSEWPGGYRDFRPGGLGIVTGAIPAVLVQYVDTVVLDHVKVVMGKDPRLSWSTLLKLSSHTVRVARLNALQVLDEAAAYAADSGPGVFQLGDSANLDESEVEDAGVVDNDAGTEGRGNDARDAELQAGVAIRDSSRGGAGSGWGWYVPTDALRGVVRGRSNAVWWGGGKQVHAAAGEERGWGSRMRDLVVNAGFGSRAASQDGCN